jgi:hypothetical protein
MSLIEIRPPATLEEYQQACAVVEDVYHERGISSQRALHHAKAIFVAVQDGTVVGAVGFRGGEQGTLPAEYYFGFDVTEVCAFPRTGVFEIIKLAARVRGDHSVFRGLVAACAQYAFADQAFDLGLAIVKPTLGQALQHFLRIPARSLQFRVVPERAAADYPHYFFEGAPPGPVAFQREDRDSYLGQLWAALGGKATVSTRDFDHRRDYSLATGYPTQNEAILV